MDRSSPSSVPRRRTDGARFSVAQARAAPAFRPSAVGHPSRLPTSQAQPCCGPRAFSHAALRPTSLTTLFGRAVSRALKGQKIQRFRGIPASTSITVSQDDVQREPASNSFRMSAAFFPSRRPRSWNQECVPTSYAKCRLNLALGTEFTGTFSGFGTIPAVYCHLTLSGRLESTKRPEFAITNAGASLQESLERAFKGTAGAQGISAQNPQVAPRFTLIETSREARRGRRASFGVASLIEVLVLLVFVWLLTAPPSLREGEGPNLFWPERVTLLAPPPASLPSSRNVTPPSQPRPLKQAAQLPKAEPKPTVPPVTSAVMTKLQPSPTPPKLTAVPPRTPLFETTVPKWEPQTRVGAFANSPAVATLSLPRSRVQTGGFGSPNGLPGKAEGGSLGNVPHLGSFDQPVGPGSGNGLDGERGARGLVASAGFGNGIARSGSAGGSAGTGNGAVHSAGFADAQAQAPASPSPKPQATPVPYEPVQVTEKPDPVYTAEARQLHIQGEVLLRVVFTVSGRVRVLGVERGLGHGLDQAATRAAEQIQFKPARRNGQPVDTTATLHILFQLAN